MKISIRRPVVRPVPVEHRCATPSFEACRSRALTCAGAWLAAWLFAGEALAASKTCPASLVGELRRNCMVAAAIPGLADGDPQGEEIGASVTAPLSPDRFRSVAQDRLAAHPETFVKQPIALGAARCFFFNVGDYRCLAPGTLSVAVTASIVIPPAAEVAVERGCTSDPPSACDVKILFVPVASRTETIDGVDVVVFRAASVILSSVPGVRP